MLPGRAVRALAGFPEVEVSTKAEFIAGQTEWIGQILAILWVCWRWR